MCFTFYLNTIPSANTPKTKTVIIVKWNATSTKSITASLWFIILPINKSYTQIATMRNARATKQIPIKRDMLSCQVSDKSP